MQTFEVRHFWRVARVHQGLESGLDQFNRSATQNYLLTKKIRFGFFTEIGLDNPSLSSANGGRVRECHIARLARRVLMQRNEHRHTTTLCIGRPDRVSWSL